MASFKNTKAFDPKSISGLQLWLDAADSSTIIGTSSVSQWNDKSGKARNVSQASAALRPSYSSTSNAVVFSGSPYLSIPNALAAITPSYTIFVVEKRASANVMFFIGQHSVGTANTGLILGYNATNISHHTTAYIADCQVTVPSYAGSSEPVKIYRYGYSGSIRYSSINGGQYFTTQSFSATLPVWTNANIGSGFLSSTYAYIGNIYEILFYNSALPTSNCQQIEGYLAWKWGLVANLPTTHPFKQAIVPFSFSPQPTRGRITQSFDPRSVSACALWLDAADLSTLSMSASAVIQWRDKSGNARNFTATQGNFTSIMDGTRRVVNIPNTTYMTCLVPLTVTASVSWLFVVAKLGRTTDPPMYLMNFTPDGDESFRYHYNTGSYGGAPGAPGDGNELLTPGQSYIHGLLNTATTYTNYHQINGPIQNTRTTTSITLSSPFGSRYFLGTLAEIILFSGPITTAQRQKIEGYLARKWGLNTNLPISHPNANPLTIAPFPYQNTPVSIKPTGRWQPTSITGCTLWLDAADKNTITISSTFVTAWRDKSGLGNHAVFDTNKPSYNALNKYVETFNNNTHIRLPAAAFTNSSSQTCILFLVYADKQEGSNNQGLFSTQDYGLYQLLRCTASYPYSYAIRGNMDRNIEKYVSFRNNLSTTNPLVYSMQYTPGIIAAPNYRVSVNSLDYNPISNNSQSVSNDVYLGGIDSFDIAGNIHSNLKIYEVVVFKNILLNTLQRQKVEGYLAWKWSLQTSLPATHPYAKFPPLP